MTALLKGRVWSRTLIVCLIASLVLGGCTSQPAPPPATPESSQAEQPATPEAPQQPTDGRSASGANGVVSTANEMASAIGLDILQQGGNAVDAAVAVSFALGLVEPNASGLGGCGYLVYAPSGSEPVFYDYRSTAPAGLDPASFVALSAAERKDGIMGAGVPGAVAGWLAVLDQYGTMSLHDLLAPTIKLAEEGFAVSPGLEGLMTDNYGKLSADEVCDSLFLNEGMPYSAGEILKNPDYASTLRLIAEQGKDGFYTGEVAQAMVDASTAKGGVITLDDLAGYTVKQSAPVRSTYRDYVIYSSAPSSSGGTAIAEGLNILERYDLAQMGQNSPEALHLMAETFKIINIDRYHYLGDEDFTDIPLDVLLSKQYATERAELISPDMVLQDLAPGDIPDESPSTTHFSVVDKEGNLIAVTNTLGTFFGCGTGVAGRGFLLDNQMNDFSVEEWEVNLPQPGKRPRSSMSPTIIMGPDGVSYATLGSPGGEAIATTMLQIIVNILDYDMPVQAAIDAPRIYQNYTGNLVVESNLGDDTLAALEEIGHQLEKKDANSSFFGGVQAIVNGGDQTWTGGADPRRDGKALAY